MSIFEKFKKRKEEDFDIEKSFDLGPELSEKPLQQTDLGISSGLPPEHTPISSPGFSVGRPAPMQPPLPPKAEEFEVRPMKEEPKNLMSNRDVELILSRLDTIKAILDSMEVRLKNLEKEIQEKQETKLW